jgi:hypothetical protein
LRDLRLVGLLAFSLLVYSEVLVIALKLGALGPGPGIAPGLLERRALMPVLALAISLAEILLLCGGAVLPAGGRGVAGWVWGRAVASVLGEMFARLLVSLKRAGILSGPIVGVAGCGPVKVTPCGMWCAGVVLCKRATGRIGIAWWALILVALPVPCALAFPARGCRSVPVLATRGTVPGGTVSGFLGVAWRFLVKTPLAWCSGVVK